MSKSIVHAARFRTFKRIIGVDLGGGKGKNTAIALLSAHKDYAHVEFLGTQSPTEDYFHDATLIEWIMEHSDDAVLAINAPLRSTVCMRCRLPKCAGLDECSDPVIAWFRTEGNRLVPRSSRDRLKPPTTPYTQRACELWLQHRYGIRPREALGQGMGPITARAHYIHRALERRFTLNVNLIEVYPRATIQVLFGDAMAERYKREANPSETRLFVLDALRGSVRGDCYDTCVNNDHAFDALVSAYTAYLWMKERWEIPVEHREIFLQDGWIWFPPPQPRPITPLSSRRRKKLSHEKR